MVWGHLRTQMSDTFPGLYCTDVGQHFNSWLFFHFTLKSASLFQIATRTVYNNYIHKYTHIRCVSCTTLPIPCVCLSQSRGKQWPSCAPVSLSVTLTGGPAVTSCFGFIGQGLNIWSCFEINRQQLAEDNSDLVVKGLTVNVRTGPVLSKQKVSEVADLPDLDFFVRLQENAW